jgi:hypothetical protein
LRFEVILYGFYVMIGRFFDVFYLLGFVGRKARADLAQGFAPVGLLLKKLLLRAVVAIRIGQSGILPLPKDGI